MRHTLILVFFLSICTPLFAQEKDAETLIGERSGALIDSTMNGLNRRATIFNSELGRVNALNPLDTNALIPDTIKRNIGAIKDFLSYLEVYRSVSTKTLQDVKDSVERIRMFIPKAKRDGYLKEFIDAYSTDHSAFEKFTLALSELYSGVRDALQFVDSTGLTGRYKVFQSQIEYDKYKADYEKYKKIISAIEKSSTKVRNAGEKSQRVTTDASIAMQKAYGKLRK